MATTIGPKYHARVQPGPDPKQTRKVSSSGKKAADKRTGKLSTLLEWEGYRVFRDGRSPTGWIDLHRLPIDGVDTNGHALRRNLRTGKLQYVDATQEEGGKFSTVGGLLGVFGGDILGLGLEAAGQKGLNAIRIQAGATAAAGILTGGAFGGGAASIAPGSPVTGGGTKGSTMSVFSDLFGGDSDGVPGFLERVSGAIDTGLDIYGRIRGGATAPAYTPTPIVAPAPVNPVNALGAIPPLLILGVAFVLFLTLRRR